jgi:hypothetical protein
MGLGYTFSVFYDKKIFATKTQRHEDTKKNIN